MRYWPDHPLAPASGLVSEARVVLFEKIGPGSHPCHWCGATVAWVVGERGNKKGNLIADHIDSDPLNDDPANLVSSCGACNITRWHTVADDEVFIVRKNGTRLRGERRDCVACGTSFVFAPDPRPDKGLYCSRSCARSGPRRR